MGDESIVDLDDVALTSEAYLAYMRQAERVAQTLQGSGIDPNDIPEEQGRVKPDGSLDIFVTLPNGKGEVSMSVPKGHWAWRQKS